MVFFKQRVQHLQATVEGVLPSTGLAYLTDDRGGHWTVTRGMAGVGVANLSPGQRLDLEVEHHKEFSIVSAYAPLD